MRLSPTAVYPPHTTLYISISYRQDVGKLIAKIYAHVCSRMLTYADYYISV